MDTLFNGFFCLLNQCLLILLALAGPDGRVYWGDFVSGLVLLVLNSAAIRVWWNDGMSKAFQFYSKLNIRCFVFLTIMGLAIATVGTVMNWR